VTNIRLAAPLALLLAWAPVQTPAAGQNGSVDVDTVHVATPTGEREADRASILAALAAVREGGTISFAAGTYLIGEMISVSTPGVSLIGHPDGTTLRGCNPEAVAGIQAGLEVCNGLELAGPGQTVRGLTFEHAFWALHLGCCFNDRTTYDFPDGSTHALPIVRRGEGGHVVEGNTFRSSSSGIRVNGGWTEPSIVRGNRFIDNWHAVSINGHTVHVLDNHFSVPQPERVPDFGYGWDAIKIAPPMPIHGESGSPACIGNVVAGNTIEGYVDGIRLEVYLPGSVCRENVIRDNTITVRRAHNPSGDQFRYGGDPSDSSVIGVPIALLNDPIFSEYAGSDAPTVVEENTVEGNRIFGAEGIGIEVLRASRNRISGNVIERVVAREPFPGNTMAGTPDAWRHANGSGIWVSAGSEGNILEGNVFDGIAHASVVREGEVEADDGARLYYRVEGEGRDTVVVVHGGPSLGLAYLAPDLVPLARGRAVVHYDQRGIGRSTPLRDPERLSIERHMQDLDALRAHLGLERLSLLGHSWGGMLAARYAAAHPERVERILLLDPMAPARDPFMAMAGARAQEMVRARLDEPARARLDSLAATAEVADPGELCRERYSLLTPIFFEDPAAAARSRADFCAGTPETLRNRPEVDGAIFGSLGGWDVRPALGHVRSPVLVVRGAEGAIPGEAMEAWVEAFPNARLLTIEGAGHYPHVDRPEVFFPAAETFFGGGWPVAEAIASRPTPVGATAPVELAIRGYLDAYAAMDPALFRAWTTDDFLLIENGYTAGFDRVVEGMDPGGPLPFTHYVLQDLEVETADDIAVYRLAVDWYRGELRIDGGIGTGHLRRTGDGWKLARDHMTLLPGRSRVAAALGEYAGEYRGLDTTGADDLLRLELDEGRLFMTRPDGRPLFGGIRRLELIPDAEDSFHLEFWGALVEFERGNGGAVATLVYLPPPRTPAAYRQPLRYGRVP
jgi:proline iminopeptidase